MLRALYLKDNIPTIISRQMQKELNYATKTRLTHAISVAVNGEKVLFMSTEKYVNQYINYIKRFIETNRWMFEESEVTYTINENKTIIKFNTGGSIEFN
jgi:hypothetical protein